MARSRRHRGPHLQPWAESSPNPACSGRTVCEALRRLSPAFGVSANPPTAEPLAAPAWFLLTPNDPYNSEPQRYSKHFFFSHELRNCTKKNQAQLDLLVDFLKFKIQEKKKSPSPNHNQGRNTTNSNLHPRKSTLRASRALNSWIP